MHQRVDICQGSRRLLGCPYHGSWLQFACSALGAPFYEKGLQITRTTEVGWGDEVKISSDIKQNQLTRDRVDWTSLREAFVPQWANRLRMTMVLSVRHHYLSYDSLPAPDSQHK